MKTEPASSDVEQVVDEQMRALGITDPQARTYVIRREGTRPGFRVTTVRLADGMARTKFIPDSETPHED